MDFPNFFVDEMVEGRFKKFRHHHQFVQAGSGTIMTDTLEYNTPFEIFGKVFDIIILKNYLTRFIKERNYFIKKITENK